MKPAFTLIPVLLATLAARGAEISLGNEMNVGPGNGNQYQSDLRINPKNDKQMLITSKRGNSEKETASFFTADAGASWSVLAQLASGDPDSVYDLTGTAHWTFIDKAGPKKITGYRRSKDGGKTWEDKRILEAEIDHLHVACDRNESSPFRNAIYIAGRTFSPGHVIVLRSRDGGDSFQITKVPLAGPLGAGFVYAMATLPDGTLVIPVMTANTFLSDSRNHWAGTLQEMYCLRSTDGGVTFSAPIKIAAINTPAGQGPGGANCLGGMAAGKFGAENRIYLSYPLDLAGQPAALMLTTSDDGGQTWAMPRCIAPPAPAGWGAGSAGTMVNTEGVLGVQWYAMKDGVNFDLYFTASTDGGATFAAPVRVSSETSKEPPKQPRTPGQDQVYGDAAPDGSFRLVWTDARNQAATYTNFFRSAKVNASAPATPATLTVTGGFGNGTYASGSVVAITAAPAPIGQEFAGWTATAGLAVADPAREISSVTVPPAGGTLTATYRPQTLYALTVEGGKGTGNFAAGTLVPIAAEAKTGSKFEKWSGPDNVGMLNPKAVTTHVMMPARAVTLSAQFK